MSARLIVLGSLLSGFLTVTVVLSGLLAFAPNTQRTVASPSPSGGSTVSPSAAPSASPVASPSPSRSPGPTGSVSRPSSTPVSAFHLGRAAPALVLSRLGGGTTDLSSLRGRPVWITFMTTSSVATRNDFPIMQRLADQYSPQGLAVLAVDVREAETAVQAFVNSVGTRFPVLLDSDGSAERSWGAFVLPIHFWLDRAGIIRNGALGELGPEVMAAGLQSIMPDATVSP